MFKRGDIIDINLNPVKGSETGKIRPCIIVTNDIYNAKVPVLQVVPITAWNEKKAKIISNVTIKPNPKNGLTKNSIADCLQTRPIDIQARFVRKRGSLEQKTMQQIDLALKKVFQLG